MTDVATHTPNSDIDTAAELVRQRRFTQEEYFRMAETGVLGPEDRTEKLVCYASNDVPEYWIVNLQTHTLECYHDPAGDEYRERRTLERGESVAPRFDDALELAVADLLPARLEDE